MFKPTAAQNSIWLYLDQFAQVLDSVVEAPQPADDDADDEDLLTYETLAEDYDDQID
jgi:hypothetical protein